MAHQQHFIRGIRVPSVTEVLSIDKPEGIKEWEIRVGEEEANRIKKVATDFGSQVHDGIEALLTDIPVKDGIGEREHLLATKAHEWVTQSGCVPIKLEAALNNPVDMYGGTTDILCYFNPDTETVWIGDWKTSKKISEDYCLQLAAYAEAARHSLKLVVNDGFILRLEKDPKKRVQVETAEFHNLRTAYYPVFKEKLDRWWSANGGKPSV